MALTLEQYAAYLDTRDLPWPAPLAPQPIKARPHLVRLPEDATVRVVADKELDIPAGRDVTVELPPASCRALPM